MLLDCANLLSGCPADLCPRADQVWLPHQCHRGHRGAPAGCGATCRIRSRWRCSAGLRSTRLGRAGGSAGCCFATPCCAPAKRRRSFPCVAFWYMRCRPRRDAFMMATAVANRQKTRGRFSSRCRTPPLRCGMYKPKTPLPAPWLSAALHRTVTDRLAPEQAQPGSRRDLPRRLLATSPDPAAKVYGKPQISSFVCDLCPVEHRRRAVSSDFCGLGCSRSGHTGREPVLRIKIADAR